MFSESNIESAFNEALHFQQAGQIDRAKECYFKLLSNFPDIQNHYIIWELFLHRHKIFNKLPRFKSRYRG
jgi:hypothetical protein